MTNITDDFKCNTLSFQLSARPHTCKNVSRNTLLLVWRSNKRGWMTKQILKDWFMSHFSPAVQCYCSDNNCPHKAVLLLDNCDDHPANINDLQSHVKVLLSSTEHSITSAVQDQNIMSAFKLDL